MVLNIDDKMAFLNEQIQQGQEKPTGQFKPILFRINENEKALVRPLRNMNDYTVVQMHELYNNAAPKESIKAICADTYNLPCALCQQEATNKKLKASVRFVIPVYVHKILRKKVDDKGRVITDKGSPVWETVTYKNSNDEQIAVSGLRLLELKRTSSILLDLNSLYGEEGDITKGDIVIERKGSGLDTKYTTTAKAPSPFSIQIEEDIDDSGILALINEACPLQAVDGSTSPALTPASANGRGKTAIDDDF